MVAKYAFAVGLVVRRGERLFEFERRLNDDTVIFIDQLEKSPHRWKLGDVHRDIQRGDLRIVAGDRASTVADSVDGLPLIFDIESLPEKHKEQVGKLASYIKGCRRKGLSRGERVAIEQAISELAESLGDSSPPSASTVMRWWRKLDRNDNVLQSLVSGHVFKKMPKRKAAAYQVAKRIIQRDYCSRTRPTIQGVTETINEELRSIGARQMLPELASVSYTTVRRCIKEIDGFALDSARYGRAYAKNKWRYSLGGTGCTRAMQRYEIDHTILDMVVICDRTGLPLGRPTITVVVDTFSGYVVGFFISFWGAGLASTFSCLKVAFGPKSEYLEPGLNLENPWLGMGVCESLVMDNGLEFHSPQMRSVAQHLDIDMLYCPVRAPWFKPVVERTFGALNLYLPPQGRVEKRLDNYIPQQPKQTSAITFSALCQGLLITFVDVHPFEVNDKKLARPFDLMSESLELLPPPCLPGPMDQLDIIVGQSTDRVIGNEGVILAYLRYNSRELNELRHQHGVKFNAEVRYNPADLGQIYVRVPASPNWLVVPSCHPDYTQGLSAVQHRAIRQLAKKELKSRNADEVLLRAKQSLRDHWMSSVKTGKRLKSQHLKAMSGLTSADVLSLSPSPRPASAAVLVEKAPLCVKDMAVPMHDIPVYETVMFG